MTKIKLNNQLIGHGCQPFIIAEAGINHNGEIENALEMINVVPNPYYGYSSYETNQLDNRVKKMVETGKLDMGHARALLSLSPPRQLEAALRIVKQGLSVRATENLVKQFLDNNQQNRPKKDSKDSNIARLESDLSERLAAKVSITHQSSGQGKLQISYNSLDELQGILKRLD